MIYLDHNATTPLDERVLEAMQPYLTRFHGNPSSLHRLGRLARGAVETAREQVAALVGAASSEVIFTSGGTEANNLALKGVAWSLPVGVIAAGGTEHPSVTEPLAYLRSRGWSVATLAVDGNGRLAPDWTRLARESQLRIVSVMLANNETGVIQDLRRLAGWCRDHEVFFHTDAVQAIGKIPVHFGTLGAHLMSLSGHKIHGPKGIGALVADRSVPLLPLLHGGGQERGLRGGTENVAAIVGFGKAAELARSELETRRTRLLALRERLEKGLAVLPGITLFARDAERLPNTVQFSLTGFDGELLVMQLDRQGCAVSSGSACAGGAHEPSPVLLAMGVDAVTAKGAVRVSLGWSNNEQEVDQLLAALHSISASSAEPLRLASA